MVSRGIGRDQAEAYLNPTLRALFPDPSSFMDMDLAAAILLDALEQQRPMAVFADYDVDGASSAAQLVRWFRAMGHDLPIYVPDRILEGYGPSPIAFRRLKDQGAELVITVDCGAAAYDAIEEATKIGYAGQQDERRIKFFSEYHKERKAKLLGHILRTDNADPLRQITFQDGTAYSKDYGKKRVGKPRQNWIHQTKKYIYEDVLQFVSYGEAKEEDDRIY
jgi:hypothetical protein